jgi:hypothetical protein
VADGEVAFTKLVQQFRAQKPTVKILVSQKISLTDKEARKVINFSFLIRTDSKDHELAAEGRRELRQYLPESSGRVEQDDRFRGYKAKQSSISGHLCRLLHWV